MKTMAERVFETVKAYPNQDQDHIAKLLGITVSHVSSCITVLEHHGLVGHGLVRLNDTARRHRGYFTVDGVRLKRTCPDCGGQMHLYGFKGAKLTLRCSECPRTVVVHE